MELKNTIQAMQKLGGNVVKEGKRILKKKKKLTISCTFSNLIFITNSKIVKKTRILIHKIVFLLLKMKLEII